MYRKGFIFVLLLVLLCSLCAQAEPRYPEQDGNTTDTARILSATALEDLSTVDKRLKKADAMRLKIATVDFLDGEDVDDYAAALFDRWDLEDEDVLLLLAIGNDEYAIFAGEDAARLLTPALQQELLREHLAPLFAQQDYEGAVASFTLAFVEEANRLYGEKVSTSGLFGRSASGLFDNFAVSQFLAGLSDEEDGSIFTRVDKSTGFSFLKVVLIVLVLLVIFGGRSSKTRSRAAGIADKVKTRFGKS